MKTLLKNIGIITLITSFSFLTACAAETVEVSEDAESLASMELPGQSFMFDQDSGLFYGTVYVRGFHMREIRKEDCGEQNCKNREYVVFSVTDSSHPKFLSHIDKQANDLHYGSMDAVDGVERTIGLGCIDEEENVIVHENRSNEYGTLEYVMQEPFAERLLASTEDNQMVLKLTSAQNSYGATTAACYSHMTEFEEYVVFE